MKILILFPRLDVPFKNLGPVSDEIGPISPLRMNWVNFLTGLNTFCKNKSFDLKVDHRPLWQYDPSMYEKTNYQYIIVPHKEKISFNIPDKKCLYLMQSPIPEFFSLDTEGWGGSLSYINKLDDIEIDTKYRDAYWEHFRYKVLKNESKFEQPRKEMDIEDYVLFITQLPHDETIKFHSKISVIDALSETISTCKALNKKLVVKGHPANPESMEPLKKVTIDSNMIWVDDVSIHSAIKNSSHCVTVNSGAGLEVIFGKKTVYTFGSSEYDSVSYKGSLSDYLSSYRDIDEGLYKNFVYRYVTELIDPHNQPSYENTFNRLGIL